MRILNLTQRFSVNRRIYAPHGSPEDTAMRRELGRLASERSVPSASWIGISSG